MNFNNPRSSLSNVLDIKKCQILYEIENMQNDTIMANSIEDIVENIINKYSLNNIVLDDEENNRTIKQGTVQKPNLFYDRNSYYEKQFYEVPGFIVSFSHNINGDINLLEHHASTYLMWHPNNLNIYDNVVTLEYSEALSENVDDVMQKIMNSYNHDLKNLKEIIQNTNNDINVFNNNLSSFIKNNVEKKKNQISLFYKFSEKLSIPLKQSPDAPTFKPIKVVKNVKPLNTKVEKETEYYIPDSDYEEIIRRIRHIGASFEKTPNTFAKLEEEELRDIIVAQLNVDYEGQAQGESFRNNGKTDICVEYNNRAAFVTECKFWKGKKVLNSTIKQLLSYTTWHDSKLAIVFFSKTNKNFFGVIDTIKENLYQLPKFKSLKEIKKNELELILNSDNQGQIIKIRIFVFNLYSKKMSEV